MDNDEFIDNPQPTDTDLKRIASLASLFVQTQQNIKYAEQELEVMKRAFDQVSAFDLPEAMNAVNMKEFVLSDGYRIKVQDVFNVRLPKPNVDKADEWLDNNGHSGMIKRVLQIELPKSMSKDALEKLKLAIDMQGFDYEEVKTVHWATINAWGSEMKNGGEMIPEDIFSVHRGNKTIITE